MQSCVLLQEKKTRLQIERVPSVPYVSLQITLASWFYPKCGDDYIRLSECCGQLMLSALTVYSLQQVNTKVNRCPTLYVVQVWWLNIYTGQTVEAHFHWPPTLRGPKASISGNGAEQREHLFTGTLSSQLYQQNVQHYRMDPNHITQLPQRQLPLLHFLCRNGLGVLKCDEWFRRRSSVQLQWRCESAEWGLGGVGEWSYVISGWWLCVNVGEEMQGWSGLSVALWHFIKAPLCSHLWAGAAVRLSTTQHSRSTTATCPTDLPCCPLLLSCPVRQLKTT